MDIRVSVSSAPLDYSMTGFAKECTSRKYCLDKLILVWVSKLYLKSLLKNLKSAPIDLYVPLTQIMRFDCHLLHLVLVKPKHYTLVNVINFSYPVTRTQVNEQRINVLSYIKIACHDYYSRYSQLNYLYIVIEICFRDEGSNW